MKRDLNVLVIDDNPADIRLMQEHVKLGGACCIYQAFNNVDDALSFLEAVKIDNNLSLPDLIFLDINMPMKNGFDFLEEVKKDNTLRNIPTIIFSTSANQFEVIRAYDIGVNCFIQKPLDSEEFGKLIERTWQFWTLCVTNPSNPPVNLGLA